LAGFLALLVRSHSGQGGAPLVALAPAAGWLAQTWFVWMGFYDFALSLALYAALLLVLEREPTPRNRLLAQAVFAGLYLTHFLTFAVGAGLACVSGAEVFGLLLLILSVVGPEQVGEGGFVAIRLRCLGVITLLPAVREALGTLRPRALAASAGVLFVTLAVHGALIVRDARIVNRNLAQLESLFTTARVPEGAWLRTRFMVYRRGLYSIGGCYHIAGRAALRRRYIVLDNYEALYHIFSVGWRTRPDWVAFRQSIEGL